MQAAMQSDSRIAIMGSAYHLPGNAVSHESYWDLLNSGRSAIRDTPPDRFDIEPFFNADGDVLGTTYARRAGYVEGVYDFDASFFRISPSRLSTGLDSWAILRARSQAAFALSGSWSWK